MDVVHDTSNLSMLTTARWCLPQMAGGNDDQRIGSRRTIGSFDDKVKYLDWWAQDESGDKRADITWQRLSLTSGYEFDSKYIFELQVCDYESCAQRLYNNSYYARDMVPGTTFAYLSCHQFAGAVATAASKMSIQELFTKHSTNHMA